ncbi:MAG: NADH-quinone oxidoreductase subunit A [candidate division Zixibacteria bacterium]|nr:NADH-quinone oxidoreductase subunit A [candidate division Zixibacteria bacterium]
MFQDFYPIILLIVITTGLALLLSGLSIFIGKRTKLGHKGEAYECGIPAKGTTTDPIPVKFYMVAISFILFDIEVIFLLPWAVVARDLGMFGFLAISVFVVVILVGYFYELGRGALKWD